MSQTPSYEFMAIPIVAGIIGVVALVLFAATEGPWAWILLGLGLLIVLGLVIRLVSEEVPAHVGRSTRRRDGLAESKRLLEHIEAELQALRGRM